MVRRLLAPPALLFFTLVLTYSYFPPSAGWNENSRFDLTRAIVEEGRLVIDSYHMNTGDKSNCGAHHCSDKAPGASLVGVLPYLVYRTYLDLRGAPLPRARVIIADPERARWRQISGADRVQVNVSFLTALYVIILFTSILPAAFAALLLVRLSRRLGAGQISSLALGGIYGVGTIAFPFSTALYGHQLAAALLLGSFVLLEEARSKVSVPGRRWQLVVAGFLGGFGLITEYPLAVPLAGLGLYLLLRLPRRREVLWFVVGAIPPCVGLGCYLWATFGSPLSPGYGHLSDAGFAQGQGQGFYGLTYPRLAALHGTLVGRFRGLLYISPVLALAVIGWIKLWHRESIRPVLLICGAVVIYFVLLNISYYMWWGGASAGPRHVIPMLPFLCLPLYVLLEHRLWRLLTAALALVSTLNVLALTAAGVKAPEYGDILFDYAYPLVLGMYERSVQPNLGMIVGLPRAASLIVILVFWTLAAIVIVQQLRQQAGEGAA